MTGDNPGNPPGQGESPPEKAGGMTSWEMKEKFWRDVFAVSRYVRDHRDIEEGKLASDLMIRLGMTQERFDLVKGCLLEADSIELSTKDGKTFYHSKEPEPKVHRPRGRPRKSPEEPVK